MMGTWQKQQVFTRCVQQMLDGNNVRKQLPSLVLLFSQLSLCIYDSTHTSFLRNLLILVCSVKLPPCCIHTSRNDVLNIFKQENWYVAKGCLFSSGTDQGLFHIIGINKTWLEKEAYKLGQGKEVSNRQYAFCSSNLQCLNKREVYIQYDFKLCDVLAGWRRMRTK